MRERAEFCKSYNLIGSDSRWNFSILYATRAALPRDWLQDLGRPVFVQKKIILKLFDRLGRTQHLGHSFFPIRRSPSWWIAYIYPEFGKLIRARGPALCIGWVYSNIVYRFILSDLPKRVYNILTYNPNDNHYYGLASGLKKTFIQCTSPGSPLTGWKTINLKKWNKMKESSSLITATEVPFIPVLLGDASQPYDAFLFPNSASKRRRRSAASYDMWGGNYIPLYNSYFSSVCK